MALLAVPAPCTAAGAQASKAIPLCPGLRVVTAIARPEGDYESIKTITAKTLVIGGTQDPGTTPADHALIAASIPGSQLVMLEAAHLLQIERQAEFLETLLQFLAA